MNIDVRATANGSDERTLGIGLERLRVRRAGAKASSDAVCLGFGAGFAGQHAAAGFWPPIVGRVVAFACALDTVAQPVQGRVEVEIELLGAGPNVAAR